MSALVIGSCPVVSTVEVGKHEERLFLRGRKAAYDVDGGTQEIRDRTGGLIADAEPHRLGRRPSRKASWRKSESLETIR